MADHYSAQADPVFNDKPVSAQTPPDPNKTAGRGIHRLLEYTTGSAEFGTLSNGDILLLWKPEKGERFHGMRVVTEALGGTATLSIGKRAADGTDTADHFKSATDASTAAMITADSNIGEEFDGNTWVTLTVGNSDAAADKLIEAFLDTFAFRG